MLMTVWISPRTVAYGWYHRFVERLKTTVEASLRLDQSEFDRLAQAVSQLTLHEKDSLLEVTELLKKELSSRTLNGAIFQVVTHFLIGGLSPTSADFVDSLFNPDARARDGWDRKILLNRVKALEDAVRRAH